MKRKLLSMILAVALAVNLTVSVSAGDVDVMMSDDTVNENAVSEDSDPGITFDGEASVEDGAADAEVEVEENADEEADSEDEDTAEGDFSDSEVDAFSDGAPEAGVNGHAVVGGYIPSAADYNVPVYNENEGARSVGVPPAYQSISSLGNKYPGVRDQNPYGTCWAFASTGLAEFDLINKEIYDKNIDLSELQLAYFTYNFVQDPLGGTAGDTAHYYNIEETPNYLNYGGNYEMAARRLSQWIGSTTESTVPYSEASNVLNSGLNDEYAYNHDVAHLKNAYIINIKQNAQAVKENIMTHGAAGVMYQHNDLGMCWNEERQLYTYYDTDYSGGGHAVMIVGWDDNFSKDNFVGYSKPSKDGAWLVRNSWGMYVNHFWMSYESTSLSEAAWIFDVNAVNDEEYDNNYQLDGGILGYPTSYTTVANVYDVNAKENVTSETLKAVSISCMKVAGVNYSIDIYTDLKDNKPTSGTLQSAAHTEGTTTYAGIYTIPLKNKVKLTPGSKFAVVVKTDKAAMDYEEARSVATGPKLETTIWDCRVSQGNGKSFYGNNYGNFWDWPYGNYCIKAFTTNNAYNTYNITYELDGGENNVNNPTTCGGNDTAIALQAPTKDGCTFAGWYLDSAYTKSITEIPAHASQDYTLYAKWSSALGDSAYGYTLNLDGNIAFNMYMNLPSDLANNKNAYMEFTFPNGSTSRMTVAEARINNNHYVFSFKVAAKEMTVDVKARMYAGDTYGKEYTVSVQKYAEYILTHSNDYGTLVVSLVKSMLNYGTAAQQLFDYQTDKPANGIMLENDKVVADYKDVFVNYKYKLTQNDTDSGIKWYGSSLILESDTCVRDYFQIDPSHNINEYTFEGIIGNNNNSIKLTPVEKTIKGTVYYYVEVPDIKAQNLDQSIKVVVSCTGQPSNTIELQYNAFSYAQVISQNPETYKKTIDVTNAMYEYWKNAREYVDSNNQSNA